MKREIAGYSFTDEDVRVAMRQVFSKFNYMLDPHGAIGYLGLKKYRTENSESSGVFLETAHPAKFLEVVESTLKTRISIPQELKSFMTARTFELSAPPSPRPESPEAPNT